MHSTRPLRSLSLPLASLASLAALASGCAAPTTSPEAEATAQSEQAMYVGCSPITQYNYLSCRPDLYVKDALITKWAPGNAWNVAPGSYITFEVANKGPVGAGPFVVNVTDYYGAVLKSVNVPGLASGQVYDVYDTAPYYDGWTRIAVVDATNEVLESNESNNTDTIETGLSPFP